MPTQSVDRGVDPHTSEAVLADVIELLVKVLGDEFLLVVDVGMGTSFNADLSLESIQFVILAEELRTSYGAKVDFVAWLASMDLDAIVTLTVGQLVEFIVGALNGREGG